LRAKCENFGFKVLQRNVPRSPWNTSRNGSQGEESNRILPKDPTRATHGDGLLDGHMENLVPLFCIVQSFPTPAVRCESTAAIEQRCFRPRIAFQSGSKEVDLVLDRERVSYKTAASVIGLSKFPYLANTRIRMTSMMFLTKDNRRMSGAEVKRKIRSQSSMGSLSISDGGSEVDMTLKSDVVCRRALLW